MVAALVPSLAVLAACSAPAEPFDVILRNGTVVDGTGRPRYEADVGIIRGFVASVGDLSGSVGVEEIDVSGLFVTPGFINLHTHDRPAALPTALNMLGQGVTTVIMNADGGGPLDLASQLESLSDAGLAINAGANIGFNAVWSSVNGNEDTRPTPAQFDEMRGIIERGLEDGAWGVSAGLDYKPAYFSRTEEVIRVLSETRRWRSYFTNHDRITPESGFSSQVGMRETVDIGEATGLTALITHMKVQGHEQGQAPQVLEMMTRASERGVLVAADAYPYLAGQTSLAALIIPGWAQAGGRDAMLTRFRDRTLRARIIAEADEALDARFGGPTGVFLPETLTELTEVMAELGLRSGGETVVRLLEVDSPGAILRFGSEGDLMRILQHPTASIACDCDASTSTVGHPRGYGTFPRVLGRYVREQRVLTWEEAVRKMTGLPATTIGMVDRGYLVPGMAADLVVFDPRTVIDHATYEDPTAASEGIVHVMVNGRWALRDGVGTGVQAGQSLARSRNMPSRAMSTAADRRVALDGTINLTAGSGTAAEVMEVSVQAIQGAAAARPSGSVRLTHRGSGTVLADASLGLLQTAGGWASLTGRLRDAFSGETHSFTIVIDANDPFVNGAGTTVSIVVEGQPPLVGRMSSIPEFEASR
ncbi:MAG: amidohydrolase family protein [Gemmatimonadetes bacterium]|nr:amidohydrolase family protein [Gemmatimonadota bacterium]